MPAPRSVGLGQSLTFHVSVNPAQTYIIDVYRVGWYGGAGGRHLLRIGPLSGTHQPACPANGSTGLIACGWSAGYTLAVPPTWTTGIFLAVLTNAAGYQNYVTFVVRDSRAAPIVYQQSVTTYQAYNNYPDDSVTGKSFYGFNSYGGTTVTGESRAVKLSFDRPYARDGVGQFFHWELPFVRWLEKNGYDVTYTTNLDTHTSGARLRGSRAFLSVGHDEYWSKEMFDAVEAARDAGVSLGFFGANAAYWQVRFEPSAGGVPNRVMVCYKYSGHLDPIQGPTTTVQFRVPPVNRPEQTLIGIQYRSYVRWGANVGYVVTNGAHPVDAGTGFLGRGHGAPARRLRDGPVGTCRNTRCRRTRHARCCRGRPTSTSRGRPNTRSRRSTGRPGARGFSRLAPFPGAGVWTTTGRDWPIRESRRRRGTCSTSSSARCPDPLRRLDAVRRHLDALDGALEAEKQLGRGRPAGRSPFRGERRTDRGRTR